MSSRDTDHDLERTAANGGRTYRPSSRQPGSYAPSGRTARRQHIESEIDNEINSSYDGSPYVSRYNSRHSSPAPHHRQLSTLYPADSDPSADDSTGKHNKRWCTKGSLRQWLAPSAALALCVGTLVYMQHGATTQLSGNSKFVSGFSPHQIFSLNSQSWPGAAAAAVNLQQPQLTCPSCPPQQQQALASCGATECQPICAQQQTPQASCPQAPACPSLEAPKCPSCPNVGGSNLPLQAGTAGTGFPLPSCRGVPVPALPSTDLSFTSSFNVNDHAVEWKVCPSDVNVYDKKKTITSMDDIQFCEPNSRNEHYWQMGWYSRMDGKNKTLRLPREAEIKTPNCIQLPPDNYRWPDKYPSLPADITVDTDPKVREQKRSQHKQYEDYESNKHDYFNWPNLRVDKITGLLDFNRGTPKNLYHFDAIYYDNEQLNVLNNAAQFIPFQQKVRLMLDMGAGGGSLGLLIQRLYDVSVISTIFADWPYCEYITERGGACMLLDAMVAMPFAKFSFDVVHAAWLYHDKHVDELFPIFQEIHRIVRPGGYLWWNGGFSKQQVKAVEEWSKKLGYKTLHSEKKPTSYTKGKEHYFGTLNDIPHELDWNTIMVKPIKAVMDVSVCDNSHKNIAIEGKKHGKK